MTGSSAGQGPGQREFVTLVALLTSLIALSIDAMLPALPELGADLGVRNPNDNQLVVAALCRTALDANHPCISVC